MEKASGLGSSLGRQPIEAAVSANRCAVQESPIRASSHASRLNRVLGKRFGDENYAVEESIAEIGAAFLCADLGTTPEPKEDHAANLAHWLKVLKADSRAIFTAASQAQRAADYLHTVVASHGLATEATTVW